MSEKRHVCPCQKAELKLLPIDVLIETNDVMEESFLKQGLFSGN